MTLEELQKYINYEYIILVDTDTCEELYKGIENNCKNYKTWYVDKIEAIIEDKYKAYLLIGIYKR